MILAIWSKVRADSALLVLAATDNSPFANVERVWASPLIQSSSVF